MIALANLHTTQFLPDKTLGGSLFFIDAPNKLFCPALDCPPVAAVAIVWSSVIRSVKSVWMKDWECHNATLDADVILGFCIHIPHDLTRHALHLISCSYVKAVELVMLTIGKDIDGGRIFATGCAPSLSLSTGATLNFADVLLRFTQCH